MSNEWLLFLAPLYLIMLVFGAVMAVWLMSLIAHDHFVDEAPLVRQARRLSLTILALGMLWGAKYAVEKAWLPWPPHILLVLGIDLYLAIAIWSSYHRFYRKPSSTIAKSSW